MDPMSDSDAIYPSDLVLRPAAIAFFRDFFRISDTPGAHDAYLEQFTNNATFILASKCSIGSKGRYQVVSFRAEIEVENSWPATDDDARDS